MLIKEEGSKVAGVYSRAAGDIAALEEDVAELVRQDRLSDFSGLGPNIRAIIAELEQDGRSSLLAELEQEYPLALLDLLKIPGLGPRTIRQLYQHLGITTPEALAQAAEAGELLNVPGIGKKNARNIMRTVQELQQGRHGITLARGWDCADALMEFLQPLDTVTHITPVGSLRRGCEFINDVDILVVSGDESSVRRRLRRYPAFTAIESEQTGYFSAQAEGIPLEVIIVPEEEYHASLLWCTGSRAHRDKIFAGRKPEDFFNCHSEAEIYEALRLHYIPPEMREDWGEIELARLQAWPEPVRQQDLQGDFHVRLQWEQGAQALREMVEAARAMQYRYIILTAQMPDARDSLFVNDQWRQLMDEIDEINDSVAGFRIIKGVECDIDRDGGLELESRYERDVDFVIAAVNRHFRLKRDEQTQRLITAIENPATDMIGRLSGRILQQRAPMDMDYDAVMAAAARRGTILEISSRPECMDMGEELIRMARRHKAKMALSSDAACAAELKNIRLGLKLARRAGVLGEHVENSLSLTRLRAGIME